MVSDIRKKKLESLARKRVSTLLTQEISDPRLGFITVTKVELDREIKLCKVFFTVLGEQKERRRVDRMLDHARGFIRTEIARILATRTAPQVVFEYDETYEKTRRLEELIDRAAADARRLEGEEPEGGEEEPRE